MRVLANSAGYVMAISTAPAVEPAMMERSGLGLFEVCLSCAAGAGGGCLEILGGAAVVMARYYRTWKRVGFQLSFSKSSRT